MSLDTDAAAYGGHRRLAAVQRHATRAGSDRIERISLYLPSRCAFVLEKRP
jgi:hypothetical protein